MRVAGVTVGKVKRKELERGRREHAARDRDQARVRADPTATSRHDPAPEDAAGRDLHRAGAGALGRGSRRRRPPRLDPGRARRWSSTRSSRPSTSPRASSSARWVREVDDAVAGSRGQGPERLARQPGRLHGRRRAAVPRARRAPRRAAAAGARRRHRARGDQRARRRAARPGPELQRGAARPPPRATTRWPRPCASCPRSSTRPGPRCAAWSASRATPARWCATCCPPPTTSGPRCATCATCRPTCAPRSAALDPLIRAGRTGVPALGRTVRGAGPGGGRAEPVPRRAQPGALPARLLPDPRLRLHHQRRRRRCRATSAASATRPTRCCSSRAASSATPSGRSTTAATSTCRRTSSTGSSRSAPTTAPTARGRSATATNRYGDVPPNDALSTPAPAKEQLRRPACFTSGPNLYDGTFYPRLQPGKAPVLKQLGPLDGFPPATQDRPEGPK